jgi:hypothetical protein
MGINRLFAACFVLALSLSSFSAEAQSRRRTAVQPPPEPCFRALDGSCLNEEIGEAARLRAAVISSVRVSYFGTPAGTIGGRFIPFERLFQDNDVLFGLPTSTCTACGGTQRSK